MVAVCWFIALVLVFVGVLFVWGGFACMLVYFGVIIGLLCFAVLVCGGFVGGFVVYRDVCWFDWFGVCGLVAWWLLGWFYLVRFALELRFCLLGWLLFVIAELFAWFL